tara:strand:+ start:1074 stop:1541 length:468 start_codon:yes stop_codon:yes gene_type:complete
MGLEFLVMLILSSVLVFTVWVTMVLGSPSKGLSDLRNEDYPKKVYTKWDYDSNFVMAFISKYYKTSNEGMVQLLSEVLNRSESSITRKISRLRGIRTNKSPYSNQSEKRAVWEVAAVGTNYAVDKFTTSLDNLEVSSDVQNNLLKFLMDAKQTNH